ncbi:MAG: type VI secretion system baseplate subunit TssG [Phycisphaerae bacterium]
MVAPPELKLDRDRLLDRLTRDGHRFDFFKAVWLLERLMPQYEPVGHRGPAAREAFRFRPDVSLGFPSTDVRRITEHQHPQTGETFYQIEVTFLGLYGVSTPLPLHYSVDVLRQVDTTTEVPGSGPAGDPAADDSPVCEGSAPMRDFLDVFHNRLTALFYRAWLKYRYPMQFGMAGRDRISDYLRWLIGLSPDHGPETYGVSPVRMIRYAGSMTQHPKSATMLEGILTDYWQTLPISVQQCVGRWVSIAPGDMNRIGRKNSMLGVDLTLGEEIYDLNGAFNIAIGPVDWETFQAFLPDGSAFAETRAAVQLYCTDPLAFSLEIKLEPNTVPAFQLGVDPAIGRLGYTSWATTRPLGATSVVLESTAAPFVESSAAKGGQAETGGGETLATL